MQSAGQLYDQRYYETYFGGIPCTRDEPHWTRFFGEIADRIVREVAPRTVLDAGCGLGFLVESLRDRGVEAWGVDVSEHAIASVREDIRPYVATASLTGPLPEGIPGRYDLVTCIEVLEHLPSEDLDAAVGTICSLTDDIIFSSTPTEYAEVTHFNVRPREYWAAAFARRGFLRDVEYDAGYVSPWSMRFQRRPLDVGAVVRDYEREVLRLREEARSRSRLLVELQSRVGELEADLAGLSGEPAARELLEARGRIGELEATLRRDARLLAVLRAARRVAGRESRLRAVLRAARGPAAIGPDRQPRDAGAAAPPAGIAQRLAGVVADRPARLVEPAGPPADPAEEAEVIARFHRLYYEAAARGATWADTWWFGVQALKCPLDLWNYQEIIHRLRPGLVVETGTLQGGSAFFLAMMLDLVGGGRVITIDVDEREGRPTHPRIEYLTGSSTDAAIVRQVGGAAASCGGPVMVILDSDHSCDHVLAELRAYGRMVTAGSYLVVEDTNVNGHPILPDFGPGPMEAVDRFLAESGDFERDPRGDRFLMTFNPRGLLRRREAASG